MHSLNADPSLSTSSQKMVFLVVMKAILNAHVSLIYPSLSYPFSHPVPSPPWSLPLKGLFLFLSSKHLKFVQIFVVPHMLPSESTYMIVFNE